MLMNHNSALDILELFSFDHLQYYFVSTLYLDNHYSYVNETPYICKAH